MRIIYHVTLVAVHRKEEVGKSLRSVHVCVDILRCLRAKEDDTRLRAKGKIKYDSLFSCVKFHLLSSFYPNCSLFMWYVLMVFHRKKEVVG